MSKYDVKNNNYNEVNIEDILVSGETVIWSGVPKKSAFIVNKSLPMLPIALIWLAVDSMVIIAAFSASETSEILWVLIPFFLIHLMPFWIWLTNVLTANKKWKNTKYVVTDRRIMIISGFIGMDYQSIYYKDIQNVRLRVGIIDKILGVGDIYFESKKSSLIAFLDIENCYQVYPKIQKIVMDIQTDIEFPNNLRPENNDGYNTKYNSKF